MLILTYSYMKTRKILILPAHPLSYQILPISLQFLLLNSMITNITKKIFFFILFLTICFSIDQKCQANDTCPINSFCNTNQYCQCQSGWALWCDLPATTLTEQAQIFQITETPSYYSIVPSSTESIFIYRFFLCAENQKTPLQATLKLFADEGTQRQLNDQNLIGNITLPIKSQCWPISSPYMDFNLQPNGKIQQMVLAINVDGRNSYSKQNEGAKATIRLNVYEIFFIKIATLWIILIVFISFVALSFILGLSFCIYQLRKGKRSFDNNIDYFEQIIPKTKITKQNYTVDHQCPVCLVSFEIGNQVRKTLCNHVFHDDCLDNWCKKNLSCPVCRSNLSKSALKQKLVSIGEINNSGIQQLQESLQLNQCRDNIKQKLINSNN